MAKAGLEIPFNLISGKLSKDSEIYYTTRYGQTVVSNYPKHRDPKKITAHQHDLNNNFLQAVAQASVELNSHDCRAYWQNQFNTPKEPKKYKTLRGFVIAQIVAAENKND